ncbi:Zinc finger BED domain-containing protein RICESLEEPER 2, partial [Linum perenne]
KARCKYCRKLLSGDSNSGTSHLRNHHRTCLQKKIHDGQQRVLGANYLPKGKAQMIATEYNLFSLKVCDLRLAIMEWCVDSNPIISQMAEKMWMKFTKYWDDIHLVLVVAVVLDPRYKLHIVEYYVVKLGVTNSDLVGDSVKKIICDLVLAYQSKSSAAEGSSSFAASASAIDLDFELFMSQRKRSRTSSVDHYLAEEIIPRAPDFDILLWWKLNGAKYPTLQRIARDFLAIPITSVASESAFSSCARLLDSHRSKLHYKTVEAMLCARSWVKDETSRGILLIDTIYKLYLTCVVCFKLSDVY